MLDISKLKALLHYDPNTGLFVWLQKPSNRVAVGSVAGTTNRVSGYVTISIDRKFYRAHRLAWFYMTGSWPEKGIDHRDGVKTNNAWVNLREADQAENGWNQPVRKISTTGRKGVFWNKRLQKYSARIKVRYKPIELGSFDDIDEAASAYEAAALLYHGSFSNLARGMAL